jgi:hypothetical protein
MKLLTKIPKRAVAEISRSWSGTDSDLDKPLLSEQFEAIITVWAERGYNLESWQLRTQMTKNLVDNSPLLTEVVIAVFVEADP